MIAVKELVWDDWNKAHIAKHKVLPKEVEEVCHGIFKAIESYRERLQIVGRTKNGRKLIIILSPEDRELKKYGSGIYYPITAFEEVK
ncbi:MAG TPA: hypothetical protein VLG12_05710 [Candidatus Saccharimonadales bacterium]|nr:hypothetical protein [Candidatus Saccharimonadales bacterium]